MDSCHLKSSESNRKFQKNLGPVVLRGGGVKDDSGSNAVFSEQGPSASHMTAANVLDVTPRLPESARPESDARSAYNQVKMEDAAKIRVCSGIRMSDHLESPTSVPMTEIGGQNSRISGTV